MALFKRPGKNVDPAHPASMTMKEAAARKAGFGAHGFTDAATGEAMGTHNNFGVPPGSAYYNPAFSHSGKHGDFMNNVGAVISAFATDPHPDDIL